MADELEFNDKRKRLLLDLSTYVMKTMKKQTDSIALAESQKVLIVDYAVPFPQDVSFGLRPEDICVRLTFSCRKHTSIYFYDTYDLF